LSTGLHPTNVRYEPAVYAVTPQFRTNKHAQGVLERITTDSTCIAMTRALGDFYAHQFGLSAEPSIKFKEIPADMDVCILVGSDGIWDCWKYEEFAIFLADSYKKKNFGENQSQEVATEIVEHSVELAKKNFGIRHFDDASFCCWRLNGTRV
jgi:serine/threonine protein phosphatase PrpC